MGAQWLSGRVLDLRPKGRGFEPHRRHCVVSLSKNINPSLVLVQPRKTRPYITERLLMGRKESNQTNNEWCVSLWLQTQGSRVWSRPDLILLGNWSWNDFYGHSPPFRWIKKGSFQLQGKVCAQSTGLLLSPACPGKKCGYVWTDCSDMSIAVGWDINHQIKQTKNLLRN